MDEVWEVDREVGSIRKLNASDQLANARESASGKKSLQNLKPLKPELLFRIDSRGFELHSDVPGFGNDVSDNVSISSASFVVVTCTELCFNLSLSSDSLVRYEDPDQRYYICFYTIDGSHFQ